jgi:hypothetical protein
VYRDRRDGNSWLSDGPTCWTYDDPAQILQKTVCRWAHHPRRSAQDDLPCRCCWIASVSRLRSDEEVRLMAETDSPEVAPVAPRSDRSPWNWLLLIPIVLPVLTPLYNFDSPRLWGFPAFYWVQFAFILVGVATTSLVYRMTRKPEPAVSVDE